MQTSHTVPDNLPVADEKEVELEALLRFARALKRIHVRLVSEGFRFEDGKLIPPDETDLDEFTN